MNKFFRVDFHHFFCPLWTDNLRIKRDTNQVNRFFNLFTFFCLKSLLNLSVQNRLILLNGNC
jgi:hypothetical protein